MRYIKSTAPCGCCEYVLGRHQGDVLERVKSIMKYVEENYTFNSKIPLQELIKKFDDGEGYTRGDVVAALLYLVEEGKLHHDWGMK